MIIVQLYVQLAILVIFLTINVKHARQVALAAYIINLIAFLARLPVVMITSNHNISTAVLRFVLMDSMAMLQIMPVMTVSTTL